MVRRTTRDRLRALKKELGFATYDVALNYMTLEVTKGDAIPPASYEQIFKDTRPIILTGESGSGKTITIRAFLSEYAGNVFLLDVSNEYSEFRKLDLGDIFNVRWDKEDQRLRFVPNSNVDISKVEAATIFSRLAFEMHSGALRTWAIVVEEGHRFGADFNLRALLIEARKFTRKIILVTTDHREFVGIGKTFKPPPWERKVPLAGIV